MPHAMATIFKGTCSTISSIQLLVLMPFLGHILSSDSFRGRDIFLEGVVLEIV